MALRKEATLALHAIYEREGSLKPSVIVKDARKKTSPLHGYFTWDDTEAAREHRLWQARQVIKRVRITIEEREEQFVHVPIVKAEGTTDREGEYKPVSVIVQQPSEYELAVNELLTKIRALQRTVRQLREVAGEHDVSDHVAIVLQSLATAEASIGLLQAD